MSTDEARRSCGSDRKPSKPTSSEDGSGGIAPVPQRSATRSSVQSAMRRMPVVEGGPSYTGDGSPRRLASSNDGGGGVAAVPLKNATRSSPPSAALKMPVAEARSSHGDDGMPPGLTSSQGGRRGTPPVPDTNAVARYIYYRLYTKDGPLKSNNPIYNNDPFIGRISSRLVRPPQTSGSLKKYLCKIEGLKSFENCALYQSLSEQTGLEDFTRLSSRGTSGWGLSDLDPMALVVEAPTDTNRSQIATAVNPLNLLERGYEQRYVYYFLYNEDGGVVPKTSFEDSNPFLGRVNTLSVSPPHTVSSLKSHIIKSEEILGHNIQLFEDEGSESTMNDSDVITLLAGTFPGFMEDQPIAIAYESQRLGTNTVTNEDPCEILARDLVKTRTASVQLQISNKTYARKMAQLREELENTKEAHARALHEVLQEMENKSKGLVEAHVNELGEAWSLLSEPQPLFNEPPFTKRLIVTQDYNSSGAPWRSVRKGDILYTDGVFRRELDPSSNLSAYCYLARTEQLKILTFVQAGIVTFF